MYDTQTVLLAFGLTAIAGLSTGIGSVIALFAKRTNTKFLSVSLGFSAGVMIYVSMIELFASANEMLGTELGAKIGTTVTVAAFFGGMFLIAVIDKLIPKKDNPHEFKDKNTISKPLTDSVETLALSAETDADAVAAKTKKNKKLMRSGLMTALALGIHNFPEGMATFVSALQDFSIAIPIVVAIAIHNIPEGIAVSVPIYYATGSRKKAFIWSFLSGLTEPLGALIGYLILMPFLNDIVFGVLYAAVAGIMVFISLDELLPSAREYGEHHLSIYGLVGGMLVMAVSLILFI